MALLDRFLNRVITKGKLTIIWHDGTERSFGTPAPEFPEVTMRFTDAKVGRDIALHPRLGFAEAYMDGRLSLDDDDVMGLVDLVRRNNPWERGRSIEKSRLLGRAAKAVSRVAAQANMRTASKKNVAHHYDLSGGLYSTRTGSTAAPTGRTRTARSIRRRRTRRRISRPSCI